MLSKIKKIFKKKQYDFKEVFKNYAAAQKYLNGQIYLDYRAVSKFYLPKDVEAEERFFAPCLIISLIKKKKINVLDIGGGNNPIFSYIKKSTKKFVFCDILETDKFLNSIKFKIPKNISRYVKYHNNLKSIKKKMDVVYFNSSIQYLENYETIIKNIKRFNPKYIFINRTFFTNKKLNFISIQYNVPNSEHPVIFFSLNKFINLFKNNNYKLILENKYQQGAFKHKNFNDTKFFLKDLVFEKIN